MKVGLKETFLSLEMVEALDDNDEEELNDQVGHYQILISEQLAQLNLNNDRIAELINTLKTVTESGEEDQSDDIDGVSLF
jgi:uncharacterized coiled-coil protein SlyX